MFGDWNESAGTGYRPRLHAGMTAIKPWPVPYFHKCYNVSRIYSGTISDLCQIHSNTSNPLNSYIFVDLPFSFALDTVILPYTIYKQATEGSLCDNQSIKGPEQ